MLHIQHTAQFNNKYLSLNKLIIILGTTLMRKSEKLTFLNGLKFIHKLSIIFALLTYTPQRYSISYINQQLNSMLCNWARQNWKINVLIQLVIVGYQCIFHRLSDKQRFAGDIFDTICKSIISWCVKKEIKGLTFLLLLVK